MREGVRAGELALPAGGVPEPFVDVEDIADVAVAALTEDGHAGRLYELTGPRLLTFADAVAEIAAATGREIAYVPMPVDAYAAALREAGVPPVEVALIAYLFGEVLDGRNAGRRRRPARARPPAARLRRLRARRRGLRGLVMIRPGDTIANPVTGERFTFTSPDDDLLAFDFALRAGRKGPDPARAPDPDRALRGRLRPRALPARLQDVRRRAGDVVEAPPGVAHGFGNAGDGEARMRVEVRPALAMADMFEEVVELAEAAG